MGSTTVLCIAVLNETREASVDVKVRWQVRMYLAEGPAVEALRISTLGTVAAAVEIDWSSRDSDRPLGRDEVKMTRLWRGTLGFTWWTNARIQFSTQSIEIRTENDGGLRRSNVDGW